MAEECVYITLGGKSPYAMVNSYYASLILHDIRPSRAYIIFDSLFRPNLDMAVETLRYINEEHELSTEVFSDDIEQNSVTACLRAFLDIVDENSGHEIILDITSGRKYMVSALMLKAWANCDHIYFLQTDALRGKEMPFLMRPIYLQYPMDLKEEVKSL